MHNFCRHNKEFHTTSKYLTMSLLASLWEAYICRTKKEALLCQNGNNMLPAPNSGGGAGNRTPDTADMSRML
jgi:hypothetical protein